MKKTSFFKLSAVLIIAVLITSCWEVNLPDEPVVYIGVQAGTLTEGVEGTVIFPVSTAYIDNEQEGTIVYYADFEGTTVADPPAGINASLSKGYANRILTFTNTESSPAAAGTYYFRITIDDVVSNVGILTIEASSEKLVLVGTQQGTVFEGTPGSVTFSVRTVNIDPNENGTIQWYQFGNNYYYPVDDPSGVSTDLTVGNANRTLTVSIGMDASAGIYYFRITIDDVESNIGILIIGDPNEKTVFVGNQEGTVNEGTPGSVTFPVRTINISVDARGIIQWYLLRENEYYPTDPPSGVSTDLTTGSLNRNMSVSIGMDASAGVYYFRVTIEGVESNLGVFIIEEPIEKSIFVDNQEGTVNEGIPGSVTFPVRTVNINPDSKGTIQWYLLRENQYYPTEPPSGVDTNLPVGSINRTLTVSIGMDASAGVYFFRVFIEDVESNLGVFIIEEPLEKSIFVDNQEGTVNAGTLGSVTFPVITVSINPESKGTIQWYRLVDNNYYPTNAPSGIFPDITTGDINRTLTMAIGMEASAGVYFFRVIIEGVESNLGVFIIEEPLGKSVFVDDQEGTVNEGTPGSVTFPVTTVNINPESKGTIQWYRLGNDNYYPTDAPSGIFPDVTTGNINRTLTMYIGMEASGNLYFFRVIIEGVESNIGALTIDGPLKK